MTQPIRRAYLELHIAVLLFGFTAILGDLIQLSALEMVWWRVLITSASMLFLVKTARIFRTLSNVDLLRFAGIGVLIALHWIGFYGAIKLANASVALICMGTTSFFTSLLEPLLIGHRVRWYELALGVLIIPGMWLVVDAVDVTMRWGVWAGLAAALLVTIFAILNKKMIHKSDPLSISFIELSAAWLFLSLLLPFYFASGDVQLRLPSASDWVYLLILSLLCTTLAYVLSLRSLRHLSAFATNLTVNLEPVYGIFLAWILLGENEEVSPKFYWGVGIIMVAVFSYPLLRKRFGKEG